MHRNQYLPARSTSDRITRSSQNSISARVSSAGPAGYIDFFQGNLQIDRACSQFAINLHVRSDISGKRGLILHRFGSIRGLSPRRWYDRTKPSHRLFETADLTPRALETMSVFGRQEIFITRTGNVTVEACSLHIYESPALHIFFPGSVPENNAFVSLYCWNRKCGCRWLITVSFFICFASPPRRAENNPDGRFEGGKSADKIHCFRYACAQIVHRSFLLTGFWKFLQVQGSLSGSLGMSFISSSSPMAARESNRVRERSTFTCLRRFLFAL